MLISDIVYHCSPATHLRGFSTLTKSVIPLMSSGGNSSNREDWAKKEIWLPVCLIYLYISRRFLFLYFSHLFEGVIKADFPRSFLLLPSTSPVTVPIMKAWVCFCSGEPLDLSASSLFSSAQRWCFRINRYGSDWTQLLRPKVPSKPKQLVTSFLNPTHTRCSDRDALIFRPSYWYDFRHHGFCYWLPLFKSILIKPMKRVVYFLCTVLKIAAGTVKI